MKKRKLDLEKMFLLSVVLLFGAYKSTQACSLMLPDPNSVKFQMRTAVAAELGITAMEISLFALTPPKITFLKPLGADCSNLDTAFYSSAYYFKKSYPQKTCTHRGVVLMRGYQLGGPTEVQDSTACLGIPIGPTVNLSGEWVNRNASTNFITRFAVSDDKRSIRVWGKCVPNDCDWGYGPLRPMAANNNFKAVFVQGNNTRTLHLIASPGEVELRTTNLTRLPGGQQISSIRLDNFVRR